MLRLPINMKQLLICIGWMISATIAVGVSISTTYFLRQSQQITLEPSVHQIYAAQERALQESGYQASYTAGDARPLLLAKFLEKYKTPLKPYDYWGSYFVQLADQYGLDYRLLPSIAMQESNLCKVTPENSFNCLGLGVHSKGTWRFNSYEENFDAAARILKRDYIDKGYITPEQIQKKYTPSSNGSWQFAVNHFMNKIESGDF